MNMSLLYMKNKKIQYVPFPERMRNKNKKIQRSCKKKNTKKQYSKNNITISKDVWL